MMPYVGRLFAVWRNRPVAILGFDATHALCVVEDRLQYVEFKEIEIPWQNDAEAVFWMEFGGSFEEVGTSDTADDSGGDAVGGDDAADGAGEGDSR